MDPVVITLTIDGEQIETTPEHPFYTAVSAPWLAIGQAEWRWTPAGELETGDRVYQSDGTTGIVQAVVVEAAPQVMYNMTVAHAHTYAVGDGQWVVHNSCRIDPRIIRFTQKTYSEIGRTADGTIYRVADNVQWLINNAHLDLPWGNPIRIFEKQPFMDSWGPRRWKNFVGDPKNLVNGQIYTLDNRRLVAYQLANRDSIPIQWAELQDIMRDIFKFSTPNGGVVIHPK